MGERRKTKEYEGRKEGRKTKECEGRKEGRKEDEGTYSAGFLCPIAV